MLSPVLIGRTASSVTLFLHGIYFFKMNLEPRYTVHCFLYVGVCVGGWVYLRVLFSLFCGTETHLLSTSRAHPVSLISPSSHSPLLSPPLPPSPLLSRSRGSLLPPPFRLFSINLFSEELATTIEGESLLNDGTAVVLFTILLKNLENVYSFQPVLNGGDITYLAIRLSLGPFDEIL